ncbi:MAG: MarR family transcriptional regulator [Gemmatimonadaceae bacterium]|nr:MarR family transcriptional regulator [Gemmatimonadaceae bacterium]
MTRIPDTTEQDAALKLWVVLSRAHEAVAELAKLDIERGELSLTEFAVLEVLYHKGDLTAGQVSDRVLLQSGSLTYVINKLVERKLIARRECETDRRLRYLRLTAWGKTLMKRIWPGHAAVIELATSGLSAAEKRTATKLLKKMGLSAALAERAGTNGA